MTSRLNIIFALMLLLWFSPGQAAPTKPVKQKIVLEHADTLRSEGSVRNLIGDVVIIRGTQILRADAGRYDAVAGTVNLAGKVTLQEELQTLAAQFINVDDHTGNYEAIGDVDYVRQDSLHIQCWSAFYTELFKRLDLYNDVVITSFSDGTVITGSSGRWEETIQTAHIEGDPVYKRPQTNSDKPDTLTILSKKIIYNQQLNSALFIGDVNLLYGDLKAISDSLFHHPDSNITKLSGTPIIWHRSDQLSGDHIDITYENDDLKTIVVKGNGLVYTEAREGDLRRNRLEGNQLFITIINDSTRHVRAVGNAEAEYHVWDEQGVYQGVNLSAGDAIELTFAGKQVDQIRLIGGINGAFYPPRFTPSIDLVKPEVEDKRIKFPQVKSIVDNMNIKK